MTKMTFKQIRDMFFDEFPQFKNERKYRKRQADFSTDCRMYFLDYVEGLYRSGMITESQRSNITLIG